MFVPSNSGTGALPLEVDNSATITPADNATLPTELLLTIQDVARHCRVSVRTIKRWVRDQRLPAPHRFTRSSPRWLARDLESYIRESLKGRS